MGYAKVDQDKLEDLAFLVRKHTTGAPSQIDAAFKRICKGWVKPPLRGRAKQLLEQSKKHE